MARPHQGHSGQDGGAVTVDYAILLPPTVLAFLTGFVWLRMGSDRLRELRTRRIHPQQVAT